MKPGEKAPELARENGVCTATMYTLKSKFGGMEVSDAQRLKGREDENRRLKHLVAGQRSTESGDPKKRLELAGVRKNVAFACEQYELGERRACKLMGMDRSRSAAFNGVSMKAYVFCLETADPEGSNYNDAHSVAQRRS